MTDVTIAGKCLLLYDVRRHQARKIPPDEAALRLHLPPVHPATDVSFGGNDIDLQFLLF